MKHRISGEEQREKKKWLSGHKLGFVSGPDAEYALSLAFRIIAGDRTAWDELDLRPDLMTNVASDLRSEGEQALADRVENMKIELNENRYIETQERSMRIRGSELRKIIKEELQRSMMKEVAGKTFKASVLVTGSDILDLTGKSYKGDLKFDDVGVPSSFVTEQGTEYFIKPDTKFVDSVNADKALPGKLVFISKDEAEVSY